MAKQNPKLPSFLLPKTKCPFEKVKVEIVVFVERPCHHCNVIWRSNGELPPCERKDKEVIQ